MDISYIIQLGMLIAALLTIYFSQKSIKDYHRLIMFSEYTRRYHDIVLNLPDGIFSLEADDHTNPPDLKTKKIIRLYFDLCSEEFHLWCKGYIPHDVWALWKDGMQDAMKKKEFSYCWNVMKHFYNDDAFIKFFDHHVLPQQKQVSGIA